MKMGKKIAAIVVVLILLIGGCRIYFNDYYYDLDTEEELISLEDTIPEPTFEYGILTDSLQFIKE